MTTRNIPSAIDLPSSKQLRNSTLIAMAIAAVILGTVVLPAEYAIDPTGIGRALQLTDMGEIKQQLALEAEEDRVVDSGIAPIAAAVAVPAAAISQPVQIKAPQTQQAWKDVTKFVLKPGEGVEYKLEMDKNAKATFNWTVEGGTVNYDTHGDGFGRNVSYEKGRGVPSKQGEIVAAFGGNHGWFWRNRGQADVSVTLKTAGDYSKLFRN